jgi:hypothetical protein
VVLQNREVVQIEALGLGTLELSYVAYWSEPHANMTGFDTAYGKPNIEYVIKAIAKDGSKKRLGSAIVTFPNRLQALYEPTGNGRDPYEYGTGLFRFKEYIQNVGVPFELPKEFVTEGDLKLLREQLAAQKEDIAEAIRYELLQEMRSETSSLHQALKELDGSVRALRGLTLLIFPRSAASNDFLRGTLFGAAPGLTADDGPIPLLTTALAEAMVTGPEVQSGKSKPSTWQAGTFLLELEDGQAKSVQAFMSAIEQIASQEPPVPQTLPQVSSRLERLEYLKQMKVLN